MWHVITRKTHVKITGHTGSQKTTQTTDNQTYKQI